MSGVRGENGIFAPGHAEVECRDEAERYFNQNDMAASHVKETHKKCKDATWKHAQVKFEKYINYIHQNIDLTSYVIFTFSLLCFQFAKIIQDMQDFVLRGQSFVLTVSSFRAAVKSHADYAKDVSNYKCHFTF